MKSTDKKQLHQLLAQVRRRLWLTVTLHALTTALWCSAALLFCGGMVHLLIRLPNIWWVLLPALLSPLITLMLVAFTRRPELEQCAAEVDRLFHGQALITSAWELLRSPPPSPPSTAPLVLQRAFAAAAQWQREISVHLPVPPFQRPVLALTVALFCGLPLLPEGEKATTGPSGGQTPTSRLALLPAPMSLPDPIAELSVQRKPDSRAITVGDQTRFKQMTATDRRGNPLSASRTVGSEGSTWITALPEAESSNSHSHSSDNHPVDGSGRSPALSFGNKSREAIAAPTSSPALTVTAEPIILAISRGEPLTPVEQRGLPLRSGAETEIQQGATQSGATIDTLTKRPELNHYSPAQRMQIANYFEQIGSVDETKR